MKKIGLKMTGRAEGRLRGAIEQYSSIRELKYYNYARRCDELSTVIELFTFHHAGYSIVPLNLMEIGKYGEMKWFEYFCTNWWENNSDKENARAVNKKHTRRQLNWYQAYTDGLLIHLLIRSDKDASKIHDWVEFDLEAEYMGEEIDYHTVEFFKLLAYKLSEKLETKKSKEFERNFILHYSPYTRILHRAWQSACEGDEAKFNSCLDKAITRLIKHKKDFYLAQHNIEKCFSILSLLALKQNPDFHITEKYKKYLLLNLD